MFGFVVANSEKLTEEQRKKYRGVYCGLCEDLGEDRGFRYRFSLTYDLVFLVIVLSAVTGEEYSEKNGRCPVYPSKKRKYLQNKYTEYAADMNIALAYYKCLDDVKDDKSPSAWAKMKLMQKQTERIKEKYPFQCAETERFLEEISEAEKNNVLIPDVPADSFGKLLGTIFAYPGIDDADKLYEFGYSLGKFIYVLDAAVDLKHDIKKKHYNPLLHYSMKDTEPILQMIMAECVEKYKALGVKQDSDIIENILYSGVWTAYDAPKKGKRK